MAKRFFVVDGPRVREIRERSGIDQPTLAAKAKITQSYLSYIELGKRNPNPAITLRLANALGVTFDEITERRETELAG